MRWSNRPKLNNWEARPGIWKFSCTFIPKHMVLLTLLRISQLINTLFNQDMQNSIEKTGFKCISYTRVCVYMLKKHFYII